MMEMNDLEVFYRSERRVLVKKLTYMCESPEDAEDVIQTAFERAIKYMHSYIGEKEDIGKWFSAIMMNSWRDYLAEKRLGGITKPLDESLKEIRPVEWVGDLPIVRRELKLMLLAEPKHIQEVMRLHLDFGLTQGEIAKLIPLMTIKRASDIIRNFRSKVIKRYE